MSVRRRVHGDLETSHRQALPGLVEPVDRRLRLHPQPEHQSLLLDRLIEKLVIAVQPDLDAEGRPGLGDASDVIQVRVCQQDDSDGQAFGRRARDELVDFVARIDEHGGVGPVGGHEVAVFHERRHGGGEDAQQLDDIIEP